MARWFTVVGPAVGGLIGMLLGQGSVEYFDALAIQRDAETYASNPETVNAMFAVTGKGLVAVQINGKECFIRADNGLGTGKFNMSCVPK